MNEPDEITKLASGSPLAVKRFTVVLVESDGIENRVLCRFCMMRGEPSHVQAVGFRCAEGMYVWFLVIGNTIHCPACLAPYKTLEEAEG